MIILRNKTFAVRIRRPAQAREITHIVDDAGNFLRKSSKKTRELNPFAFIGKNKFGLDAKGQQVRNRGIRVPLHV